MKTTFKALLFALMITLSTSTWAELASYSLELGPEQTVETTILELYKSEAAKVGSPLALELERIKREQVEDMGTIYEPGERDMWIISSGRGGYGHYGRTYLLGVPVLWNGTGMIEEYIEYVRVSVSLQIGEGEEGEKITVTFDQMVQINL